MSRAHAVTDVENELLALYADPSVDTKPEALTRRGGAFYSEAAVDLLASLTADRGDVQVVNVRNDGTLPFLPDDHVIEVPARVGASGITPLPVAPLADDLAGPGRARRRVRAARARRGRARRSGPGHRARSWRTRWSGSTTRRPR